jgi:hypothetical protein
MPIAPLPIARRIWYFPSCLGTSLKGLQGDDDARERPGIRAAGDEGTARLQVHVTTIEARLRGRPASAAMAWAMLPESHVPSRRAAPLQAIHMSENGEYGACGCL